MLEYGQYAVTRFWHLSVAILMTITGISATCAFDLMTVAILSKKQLTVSMTVTWIHHALKYTLHTPTRLWHLFAAILMTVAGIRVAHNFDSTTITSCSLIQVVQ